MKVKWTELKTNEEVLEMVQEKRVLIKAKTEELGRAVPTTKVTKEACFKFILGEGKKTSP